MIYIKNLILVFFSKPKEKTLNKLFFYYFYIVILLLSLIQYIFQIIKGNSFLKETLLFLIFTIIFSIIFRLDKIKFLITHNKKKTN